MFSRVFVILSIESGMGMPGPRSQVPSGGMGMPGPRSLQGVCMPGTSLPRRYPPGNLHYSGKTPGKLSTAPGRYIPLEGTLQECTPHQYWHLVVAIKVGGMHSTGMHSCLPYFHTAYKFLMGSKRQFRDVLLVAQTQGEKKKVFQWIECCVLMDISTENKVTV